MRSTTKDPSTYQLCHSALLVDGSIYTKIPIPVRNRICANTLIDICIAFRPLKLPSYVLDEIIECVLRTMFLTDKSRLKHKHRMDLIIRINERDREHIKSDFLSSIRDQVPPILFDDLGS